ncbi:MAG TPA: ATP-binding protein [Bryobacteraceae bacterium]|jgi:serine/threonine-protein kinase RsbW|nr:ATP-binding protein [Bryobacteraceae bacterium]
MADQEGLQARTVDQLLDSTLDSVDVAEEAVLKEAEELGFEEDDLHKIGMSVRECMVNAVVHGNRYNARKKVHVMIQRTADRLAVVIQDEGDGFDMADLPDPLANENLLRHSGRGLLLIQAFMDEFQIRPREPKGTEVKMVKILAKAS